MSGLLALFENTGDTHQEGLEDLVNWKTDEMRAMLEEMQVMQRHWIDDMGMSLTHLPKNLKTARVGLANEQQTLVELQEQEWYLLNSLMTSVNPDDQLANWVRDRQQAETREMRHALGRTLNRALEKREKKQWEQEGLEWTERRDAWENGAREWDKCEEFERQWEERERQWELDWEEYAQTTLKWMEVDPSQQAETAQNHAEKLKQWERDRIEQDREWKELEGNWKVWRQWEQRWDKAEEERDKVERDQDEEDRDKVERDRDREEQEHDKGQSQLENSERDWREKQLHWRDEQRQRRQQERDWREEQREWRKQRRQKQEEEQHRWKQQWRRRQGRQRLKQEEKRPQEERRRGGPEQQQQWQEEIQRRTEERQRREEERQRREGERQRQKRERERRSRELNRQDKQRKHWERQKMREQERQERATQESPDLLSKGRKQAKMEKWKKKGLELSLPLSDKQLVELNQLQLLSQESLPLCTIRVEQLEQQLSQLEMEWNRLGPRKMRLEYAQAKDAAKLEDAGRNWLTLDSLAERWLAQPDLMSWFPLDEKDLKERRQLRLLDLVLDNNSAFTTQSPKLDALLVFAGLFSAILSAFLIEIRKGLEEDLLLAILQQLQNTPRPFQPTPVSIWVNGLWFASLAASLAGSLIVMLAKSRGQWTWGEKEAEALFSTPKGLKRRRREIGRLPIHTGFKRELALLTVTASILVYIALILFASGLSVLLYTTQKSLGISFLAIISSMGLFIFGVLFYNISAYYGAVCYY